MKFADGLLKAYETKWSFVNTFTVQFHIPDTLKKASGWNDEIDGRDINLHIVNINTPQFTNQNIETFIANRWVMHNGRDELYRFEVTFRDKDQMSLYRKFLRMYQATREDYFDNVKMAIQLMKDGDYYSEINDTMFYFDETLIDSISQLQFSNDTENQVAEFTVAFKTRSPFLG